MAKVKVLIDSLEHDGKRRKVGELIEVENPKQLMALGAVELVKEPAKPKDPPK